MTLDLDHVLSIVRKHFETSVPVAEIATFNIGDWIVCTHKEIINTCILMCGSMCAYFTRCTCLYAAAPFAARVAAASLSRRHAASICNFRSARICASVCATLSAALSDALPLS